MLGGKSELVTVAAPYSKLENVTVANKLVTSSEHARVGEFLPEVIISQIRVGIKVYYVKIGVFFADCSYRSERHKMLAADHERHFAVIQNSARSLGYVVNCAVGITERKFKVSAVKIAVVEHILVNSGCICCSLVGDFGRALKKVIADYAPDRILIEPSGVGKLSDVIGAVRKVTSDDVQLGNFVTVADATKCKMYMKNFGEFYNNQIETANTIILSRTDGMAEEKLDQCVAMIREHNKDAVIVTTPWPELTGEQLMEAMEQRSTIAIELAKLEEEAHHHHDHDDDDECDDPNCACHHHHHDDEEDEDEHAHEHHHHHHDDDEDEECDDPDCACHHHHDDDDDDEHEHHHHHHHHHGHDADEVFISWGEETHKKFTKAEIERILKALEDADTYGIVLRAKGYVANAEGEKWIHFDYVPGEPDIRDGGAMVTGRICVIGSKLNEEAVAALFGVEKQ